MTRDNSVTGSNIGSLKDEFCVWSDGGRANAEYDISEEYVLPDYYPDIKKILLIKARAEEGEFFPRDGVAEYGGDVVFSVIYLGDNGQIKCVERSYPYTNGISMENIYSDSVITYDTAVKNRSVRALSPRKLLFKGKAVTEISVRNKLCVSPRLVGAAGIEDEFTVERKTDTVECMNIVQFTEKDIRSSEDIEYKGKFPIKELVCYDCNVFVTDCRYSGGKLAVKGVAKLFCLIGSGPDENDMHYEVFEKNIPLEHNGEMRLPFSEAVCCVRPVFKAIEVGVANDSYGEARILETDISWDAEVTAAGNETALFTDDVFSTAYRYENTYMTVETERLIKCLYGNFSSDGSIDISKNDGTELEGVLMSDSEAEMRLKEFKDGKGVFEGECNVKAVLKDKNDGYITADMNIPLRYEGALEEGKLCECVCRCSVLECRLSLDGTKLSARIETGIEAMVTERISADTVSRISIDKSSPVNENGERVMILYYPEKGETLWSVAKKYGVSRAALESTNNKDLSGELPRVMVIPSYPVK